MKRIKGLGEHIICAHYFIICIIKIILYINHKPLQCFSEKIL